MLMTIQPTHLRSAAALLLALASLSAQAASTLYTEATAYQAALGSLGLAGSQVNADIGAFAAANGVTDSDIYAVIDNGSPNSITIAPVTLTGLNADTGYGFVVQNTYGVTGAFYSHQLSDGTANAVRLSFATPVKGFSFVSNVLNFTADGSTTPTALTLATSHGDVLNALTTPLYDGSVALGTAPLSFNAVISDTAFSSVTLTTTGQAFDITSLSAVPVPVPEPGTYAMLLAGLGVVLTLSRRRKQD